MKRVIVTGGTGFVGHALVRELLNNGIEVYAVVRPGYVQSGRVSRLTGLDVKLAECGIEEIGRLPEILPVRGFDAWYQFAWDGLTGERMTDYATQIMNIRWTVDAVVAAASMQCKRFIGSGSVSQYELSAPDGVVSQYDKHRVFKTAKQACEYMGRSVAQQQGIEFIWPIITNTYGPGESSPRLINSMIRNLLAGKRQALSEGNQYYDFIYIDDAAKAFRLIGERGKENRTYRIAQGCVQPLKNFLCTVRDVVAPEAELGFGELAFNGIYLPAECYENTALVEDTGFAPDVSFEEGVRRTADWIRKHKE